MVDPQDVPLEDLVADCAERLDAEGEAALRALCDSHPRHARALREAMAPLLSFGVVGPTAAPEGAAPRQLGEFELLREIGRGGMGVVYEARQPALDRTVALKVLPSAWVLDPRQVTRFQNEARAAATLDHPHIVRVHAVGTESGTHFYAMQLVDGVSVRSVLRELRGGEPADERARAVLSGLLPHASAGERPASASGARARRAADLARQAASALGKAHEAGILHRDVKPGNLLVDRSGHLWVTDFGLAHFARDASDLTRSGEFVGTLAYSSPEQVGGRVTVDARSDVYSLGATLYEMLTLRPPFAAGDHAALVRQIGETEPKAVRDLDPRIPRDLGTIVQKAMAKEPTQRYQTATALAEDLGAFLDARPIHARPVTAMQRALRWCMRKPGQASAVTAIALLTLVASVVLWAALRATRERDRAVTAESALSRLSSQHKISSRREAAESRRRSLAAGRRSESLRLLREATDEIPSAAATPEEAAALRAQLRSDILASLCLWDATAEPMPGLEGAIPLGFDRSLARAAALLGDHVVVRDRAGSELARLEATGADASATFSDDGEWIAVRMDDRARLWHWRSGRVLAPPGGTLVRATCFDHERQRFVACLEGNRFVACDLSSGEWRDLLGPAAQQVASGLDQPWQIELSPDGKSLAACHRQLDKLLVYRLGADHAPRAIALPDHPIACLWLDGGARILAGGRFHDLLQVDAEAGTILGSWPGHHAEVFVLARSERGDLLCSSGWDGQVGIWDRQGRALVSLVLPRPAPQLALADLDRTLGWGTDGAGRPVRWQLHRPAVLRELDAGDRPHSNLPWVAFHPTAPLLAFSTLASVLLFDSERGERIGELPGEAARRLRFLEDGSLLVASPGRAGCRLHPVVAGAGEVRIGPARTLAPGTPLREADAHSGRLFAWGEKRIRVATLDGRELASVEAAAAHGVHLRADHGGRHAALGTFGGETVAVWDLVAGTKAFETPAPKRCATLAFAPDGGRMVITGCDEHRVLEVGTWRQIGSIPRRRVDAVAGYAAFSPDGALLALPATRTRLQVCEAATFTPLFELEMPDGGDLCEVAFRADGSELAAGSVHRKVFVWDLRAARAELRALGLDWSDAPIPPVRPPRERLRLVIER